MTTALRTALPSARARRTARHPASAGPRDSRAPVGGSAARAAGRRRHNRPTALTPAR